MKLFGIPILLLAVAGSAAGQTTQQYRTGLDTLHDDRLISELASRGLTDLLDRAFEINQIPQEKRAGIRAMAALGQLKDDEILSPARRRELIASIAGGIEQALPLLDEPQVIMRQAGLLIRLGIERDVNTLEYWGENPRTQASLRPVAQAVIKLLGRAEDVARREAEEIGNQLTGPADLRARVWEDLSNLANNAAYTRHMVMYALALALPAGSNERYDTAGQAIEYLKQFDHPARTVGPTVRSRIAKLHMARDALDAARELWNTLIEPAPDIQPRPDLNQQFEARYFAVLCDLMAGKTTEAQQTFDALVAWHSASLPADAKTRDGTDAAIAMLKYRLASAGGKAPAEARDILLALVKRRPDLRGVVSEQLLATMPADLNVRGLDPLLLSAVIQKADAERLRPAGEKVDAAVLERGIAAARELVLRRGRADIDVQIINDAALLIPLFQEKLGRDIEAATGLLDLLRDFGTEGRNATIALDAAQAVIGRLRADPKRADDPAVVGAYERLLPVALSQPFARKELAFEYARLLQSRGAFKQAAEYFAQVPSNDPRLASARFYQMVSTRQRLDDPALGPAERANVVKHFQMLSDQVAALAEDSLNQATTDAQRARWRGIIVRTMLLASDVARREQNNPERTLTLLESVEQAAAGLPGEKELLASALYTRVQAHLSLGQHNLATTSLVKLIQTKSAGEGASIVHDLMRRLNHELDQAQQQDDRKRMAQIAANRAQLSGFLVTWASDNSDPNIRRFAYRYSVFDAAAKRLAADLIDNPHERIKSLLATLELYRKLEAPQQVALYKETIDPASGVNPNEPDPQVSLGIGLLCYDVGDFAEAQRRLGQLLIDRKLGSPTLLVEENGIERTIENDGYWEATLKLLRSNLELAKTNKTDPTATAALRQSQSHLKQLYITWGDQTGGKKWHGEFEKLRLELIGDFAVSGS